MNETGRDNRIEAYFLGVLALVVFGVVIFAAVTTKFGASASSGTVAGNTVTKSTPAGGYVQTIAVDSGKSDIICTCYNNGFELAGKTSNVQGTAYRTGYSQCRALADFEGGQAWTAGWEARLSGRTYEATCRAYKRRNR